MIKVGIAGIGFMGWIHWLAYQQIEGVKVVAICDSDPVRLTGDWTSIAGNFGPAGEHVDLSDIEVFDDINRLCQSDFDLLDICLPPSMHTAAIRSGTENGKHVFCEKPLALNLAECESSLNACRDAGKLLFVGHVLPFFPEFQAAKEIVESGKYGKLVGGYFKRVISSPTWLPDFFDPVKIGGPLFDLHVHDAHLIRLLAGLPTGVYAKGRLEGNVVRFCHSIFDFEDQELTIAATSGVINQQGRPFTHGFEIHLSDATLHFEYAALKSGDESSPLKVLTADGQVNQVPIESSDPANAFVAEIREVVTCIANQQRSAVLAGELARDAIKICEAESSSVKQSKRVEI